MDEYIKREDALNILENGEGWLIEKLYDDILHLPATDVAKVRHGKWIKEPGAWHLDNKQKTLVNILRCSVCGMYFQNAPYNYCPNCGARMDQEDEYDR